MAWVPLSGRDRRHHWSVLLELYYTARNTKLRTQIKKKMKRKYEERTITHFTSQTNKTQNTYHTTQQKKSNQNTKHKEENPKLKLDGKLDGVAPLMTDPPPISSTTLSGEKKEKKKWHMTRDMWHVTRDMWHVTRLGGWTFTQNFSSLALTVCDLWYYEDILGKGWLNELMNEWVNELINDKAVCRTAPATPGLSNIVYNWEEINTNFCNRRKYTRAGRQRLLLELLLYLKNCHANQGWFCLFWLRSKIPTYMLRNEEKIILFFLIIYHYFRFGLGIVTTHLTSYPQKIILLS